METIKTNISNAYSAAAATLDDSESAAKNDEIHLKASQLDRLHEVMKEKLAIAPYPHCTMSMAPDAQSSKYCAEYFNVSEYLVGTSRKLKKRVCGILAKPSPKRGKKIFTRNN